MKPKIFVHGACDLYDIMTTDVISQNYTVADHRWKYLGNSNASLDLQKMCFPATGSSLRSIYTPPGSLAFRVYEDLINQDLHSKILCKTVFQEIMKFPYFDFYRKHSTPNDFLVISFSSEVFSKCEYGNEVFTCFPALHELASSTHPLHWLFKECLVDENIKSFDDRFNQNYTTELIKQFAQDIYPIFGDRVILVKTHFTPLVRYPNRVVKVNSFADNSIPFYKRSKVITDSRDLYYVEKSTSIAEKRFKVNYKSDIPYVKVDEALYVDANHKWGATQFHLDLPSRTKVATAIHNEIVKKQKELAAANKYSSALGQDGLSEDSNP